MKYAILAIKPPKGVKLLEGPRGGLYYIDKNGQKKYVVSDKNNSNSNLPAIKTNNSPAKTKKAKNKVKTPSSGMLANVFNKLKKLPKMCKAAARAFIEAGKEEQEQIVKNTAKSINKAVKKNKLPKRVDNFPAISEDLKNDESIKLPSKKEVVESAVAKTWKKLENNTREVLSDKYGIPGAMLMTAGYMLAFAAFALGAKTTTEDGKSLGNEFKDWFKIPREMTIEEMEEEQQKEQKETEWYDARRNLEMTRFRQHLREQGIDPDKYFDALQKREIEKQLKENNIDNDDIQDAEYVVSNK